VIYVARSNSECSVNVLNGRIKIYIDDNNSSKIFSLKNTTAHKNIQFSFNSEELKAGLKLTLLDSNITLSLAENSMNLKQVTDDENISVFIPIIVYKQERFDQYKYTSTVTLDNKTFYRNFNMQSMIGDVIKLRIENTNIPKLTITNYIDNNVRSVSKITSSNGKLAMNNKLQNYNQSIHISRDSIFNLVRMFEGCDYVNIFFTEAARPVIFSGVNKYEMFSAACIIF